MADPLVDVTEVASQLHKVSTSDLPVLTEHLQTASNLIVSMCLPVQPDTVTDLLDGGQSTVMLSRYPVNAVTSVTTYDSAGPSVITEAGGTTGLIDGWSLDYQSGALRRVGRYVWPSGVGNVQVVYTVGPATVPAEVQRAAIVLTEHLWQFRRIQGGPNQPNVPGGNDAMGYAPSYAVPNQVIELLRAWLKPPRVA